jgi:hypothetical protein
MGIKKKKKKKVFSNIVLYLNCRNGTFFVNQFVKSDLNELF